MSEAQTPADPENGEPLRRRINRRAHYLGAKEAARQKEAMLAALIVAQRAGSNRHQQAALIDGWQ